MCVYDIIHILIYLNICIPNKYSACATTLHYDVTRAAAATVPTAALTKYHHIIYSIIALNQFIHTHAFCHVIFYIPRA